MIGKLDEYLRFNETALSLRSQRQELLASNIANADTPRRATSIFPAPCKVRCRVRRTRDR